MTPHGTKDYCLVPVGIFNRDKRCRLRSFSSSHLTPLPLPTSPPSPFTLKLFPRVPLPSSLPGAGGDEHSARLRLGTACSLACSRPTRAGGDALMVAVGASRQATAPAAAVVGCRATTTARPDASVGRRAVAKHRGRQGSRRLRSINRGGCFKTSACLC